jgi:protein TIF31
MPASMYYYIIFFTVEGEELSKTMTELGFPRLHRHKLACLRQELIETFVE